MTPQHIGRYELHGKIGQGGLASIFRLVAFAIVAGVLAACGVSSGGEVAPTATITPIIEPTAIPVPDPSLMPTPTQNPVFALAEQGVTHNDKWIPYAEEFDGVEMALVPPGCFMMGPTEGYGDTKKVREVCFEEPYWVDVYEVTHKQFGSADDNRPVTSATWFEATEFCEARGVRLPTEAEWEYAARGPDSLTYPWGNEIVIENVVSSRNGAEHTADVGSIPEGASWVGAYDLSGNAWEWVNDWYDVNYITTLDEPIINPQGPDDGMFRVIRGGGWSSPYQLLSSVVREYSQPDAAAGFRCARAWGP